MTTTNGTRASMPAPGPQRSCGLIRQPIRNGSLAVAPTIRQLLLVCAGTQDHASLEDALAAGRWPMKSGPWCRPLGSTTAYGSPGDLYRARRARLLRAVAEGRNGHRLLSQPQLAGDVPDCLDRDRFSFIARLDSGAVFGPRSCNHEVFRNGKTLSKPTKLSASARNDIGSQGPILLPTGRVARPTSVARPLPGGHEWLLRSPAFGHVAYLESTKITG